MKVYLGNQLDLKNKKFVSVKSLTRFLTNLKDEIVTIVIKDRVIDEMPLIIDKKLTMGLKHLRVTSRCGSFFCAKKLKTIVKDGYTYAKIKGDCRAFFADGKPLQCSKLPKNGYFTVKKTCGDRFSSFYGESEKDIDANTLLTVWPGGNGGTENWHTITCPISEYDSKSGLIRMSITSPLLELGKGSRYKFENVKTLEDGEFFMDKEKREVGIKGEYAEIYGVSKSSAVIVKDNQCPVKIDGIEIYGGNRDKVIHGEFGQKNGLIYLENCNDVVVENCYIHDTGSHAISVYGNNKGIKIKSNLIKNANHTGVAIVGYDGRNYKSEEHFVINNRIESVGLTVGHASGVSVVKAKRIVIKNNTILNSPRYGISVKGRASAYLKNGRLIDSNDFEKSENDVKIIGNDLSRCNLDSQDTGIIEGYFARKMIIKNNYLHDSNIPFSFGTGIYLDDECYKVKVVGNLIERLGSEGSGRLSNAITVKGEGHEVCDNKIRNCNIEKNGGYINVLHLGDGVTKKTKIYSNSFTASGNTFLACSNWSSDRIDFCNLNIFDCKPNLKGVFFSLAETELEEWKKNCYDTLSIIGGNEEENYPLLGVTAFDKLKVGSSVGEFCEPKSLIVTADGKGEEIVYAKVGDETSIGVFAVDEKGVKKQIYDCEIKVEGNAKKIGNKLFCETRGKIKVIAKAYGLESCLNIFVANENPSLDCLISSSWAVSEREVEILPYLDYGSFKKSTLSVSYKCENCSVKKTAKGLKVRLGVGYCSILIKKDGLERLVELTGRKEILDSLSVSDIFCLAGEKVKIPYTAKDENGKEKKVTVTVDGKESNGDIRLLKCGVTERRLAVTDEIVVLEKKFKTVVCQPYLGDMKFANIGDCNGIVGEMDGKTVIASNGENVWFNADKVTYLYENIHSDFVVTLRVGDFFCPNKNSQCGILIRDSIDPSAKTFNLRISGDGSYMVAMRKEFNNGVIGAYSSLPIFLPELKVVKKNQTLTAFVNGEEFYLLEGFEGEELCVGIGLFSGDRAQSSYVKIDEYKVEKF